MTKELENLRESTRDIAAIESVEEAGGFPELLVQGDSSRGRISLYGGQVLEWEPTAPSDSGGPVLWTSRQRHTVAGKAVRGGLPVCWPWFGPHPQGSSRPSHGVARTRLWRLQQAAERDGVVHVVLELPIDAAIRDLWPHAAELRLEAVFGDALEVGVTTRNTGSDPFLLGQALHSYFRVGDISRVSIEGLEGRPYIDQLVGDEAAERQRQEGPVRIDREVDRIYLETDDECRLVDAALERSIHISKSGSRSTVVWNPWVDKSRSLADMADDEYRGMVCVETTNAADDVLTLEPGEEHRLTARIEVSR